MRAKDIKQNEVYRLKSSPNYGYVKVLCVLNPKQCLVYKDFRGFYQNDTNPQNYILVKCIHSCNKDFSFGLIKWFRPIDIII
jgi:hypothetical protein